MAFNYAELTRIKGKITTDTETLTAKLSAFSELVDSKVNNKQVWLGDSATNFKKQWDDFANVKFPQYKSHFNKEISNVSVAIEAWRQSEGK